MISLTETVLFFWDFFDTSSSTKGSLAGVGKVKDWTEKTKAIRAANSCASKSAPQHSRVSSLLKPSRVLKGSTRSTSSNATQPPPTPGSVSSIPAPVSFLDEEDESTGFNCDMQESTEKRGTGVCYFYDQYILCGD